MLRGAQVGVCQAVLPLRGCGSNRSTCCISCSGSVRQETQQQQQQQAVPSAKAA